VAWASRPWSTGKMPVPHRPVAWASRPWSTGKMPVPHLQTKSLARTSCGLTENSAY